MQKLIKNIFLVILILASNGIFPFFKLNKALAAFDVKGVQLFRDNNLCINSASGGTVTATGLSLSTLQTDSESVQSKISSGGSLCTVPSFFTGGALLSTAGGISIQAQPNVQSLGRGVLVSEVAGNSSGVTSSGDPNGFSQLASRFGGLANLVFEINLPTGCDIVDDDDDIVGTSTELSTVNDFTFPTCVATNGLTVACNAVSNLLTATTGLSPASGSTPAKIRFAISSINATADSNMVDSILVKLDSQDIFCPQTATGSLTATVTAQNATAASTKSETLGTADLGTATQAATINYAVETSSSLKGEISTNEAGSTPIIIGSTASAHKLQIEELDNQSIPLGGESSPILINRFATSTLAIETINIWVTPSVSTLFSSAPTASDITFSDNSLVVSSNPYLVKTSSDDANAPYGTIVIPVGIKSGGTNPSTVKTTISIDNLKLNSGTGKSGDIITVNLAFFEPVSGAIINTPAVLSVNDSSNPTNPQNFSAFAVGSLLAVTQNGIVGGAVNEQSVATQITSASDLIAATNRDTILGGPQVINFAKIISSVPDIDPNSISVSNSSSVLTVTGSADSTIGGASVAIESLSGAMSSIFDSVTITSKTDGSFTAKLKGDFSDGNVTLSFKQTVSGSGSKTTTKIVSGNQQTSSSSSGGLSCEQTVCGCENTSCTPSLSQVTTYIQGNGGLGQIVSSGGALLQEVIQSVKKVLGLS